MQTRIDLSEVQQSLSKISKLILNREPFLIKVTDKTYAGGAHAVNILINPQKQKVFIEVPDEPVIGLKGGRNPTIYHGIEIITASYQIAKQSFPHIEFGLASNNYLETLLKNNYQVNLEPILISLEIDPPKTNVIIFHTQVTHINPEILARLWYEVMKLDQDLVNDIIRHTSLVMPISSSNKYFNANFEHDQPEAKAQAYSEVMQNLFARDRNRFRLMHPSRISRWGTIPILNQYQNLKIQKSGLRSIINLIQVVQD